MTAETESIDNFHDPIDIGLGRVGFHYDEHKKVIPVYPAKIRL